MLLGNLTQESFRPEEFGAYYRRVCRRLEEFVADPPETKPYPCDHCGICEFKPLCDEYWDLVDHPSRVADIQRRQIDRLAAAGITTLEDLGTAPAEPVPTGIAADTFEKLRSQAKLQLRARFTGEDSFVILPPQAGSGFALLPEPSRGDLFFDFEGNPFWDHEGSLEYLWGILDTDGVFEPLVATTRDEERQAFEDFVDLVHERLAADPALHVYHYASYEITALRRLMGKYGTREAELDDLLRRGVFVDLLKVVRGGLRTSRPGYGLKEMEAFLDFQPDGGDPGGRRLDRRLRGLDGDPRPGDAGHDRGLQPRGLHRHAAPARLAARAAAGCARRLRAVPRCRSRSSRSPCRKGRPSARRCANSSWRPATRRPRSRRSCSTTTTGSASRSGGRSSTGWR